MVVITAIRSAAFALAFYLGSVFFVVIAFLAIPFGRGPVVAMAYAWAQYHHLCIRWLLGIRIRVEGVLPQSGAIIACKHEAMVETIEMLRLLSRGAVVFKAELLKIPLWSRVALAHGVIPVERESGAAALRRMLVAARAAVAEGRPILIYPEGTRVPPGQMPPLRPGVAGLYKALALPVVPVALDSGRLWPRGSFLKRAGVLTISVGETIPPGLPRNEVEARIHAAINVLNLRAQAPGFS